MASQCAGITWGFPGQEVAFALCTILYNQEYRRLEEKLKTDLADMDVSSRGDYGNLDILISFGTEPTVEPTVLQFVTFSIDGSSYAQVDMQCHWYRSVPPFPVLSDTDRAQC
jgi:hypothetical protein